jgi:putative tryptophan/tyrosine transport system substrate-binding protein
VKRREFITLLGGAAMWPLAARAQQAGKRTTLGYLGAASSSSENQRVAVLLQRLRELGWVEGRNLAIEYRWAEGRSERFPEIAAEFIKLKVDVIVAAGTAAVKAARETTSDTAIVFPFGGDLIAMGLVGSLARPGGNITGLSTLAADLAGKRLELLREAVPKVQRLGLTGNIGDPAAVLEMERVRTAARTLGLDVIGFEIRRPKDISPAFDAFKRGADAVYIALDPLIGVNRTQINILAAAAGLPTISNTRVFVEAGGLMSYGPNFLDLYRRAADLIDKILRGTKPADIPVEQPTKFDLVINLTTAKALGLEVPPALLARADEVIE